MSTGADPAPGEHRRPSGQLSPYVRAKMGMWIFLLTEILLFGGLFLLYAAYRTRYAADFHAAAGELDRGLGAFNTLILLTSSLTMALGVAAAHRGNRTRAAVLQAVTAALGLAFLGNKGVEWGGKIAHGLYPDAPGLLARGPGQILFFSLYYIMTGLHGFHVLVGVGVLAVLALRVGRGAEDAGDAVVVENAGLYWHLVDLVWIYLFPLFYLIA